MIEQIQLTLRARPRGIHLVTDEILRGLPSLPLKGLVNVFVHHTSCGLAINESYDPDVRHDLEAVLDRLVPENEPGMLHTLEGADDMPAHAKAVLSGVSLVIPISNHRLALGTWQGIYLCEYRHDGGPRRITITIIGE